MIELLPNRSIVIVGSWNVKIFQPQWIDSHLRRGGGQTEFAFMMGGPTHHLQATFDKCILILASDRIVLKPKDLDDSSLSNIEETAALILERLTHTPLVALGINFAFEESAPTQDELNIFNFPDKNKISDNSFRISSQVIKRTLVKDDLQLNVSISIGEDSKVLYEFNYHSPVSTCAEVINLIRSKILGLKNNSLQFMETIYGKHPA